MSNEPEYLQRLRKSQEERARRAAGTGAAPGSAATNVQEQEALRWAREVSKGTELRSIRNLAGSRFAAVLRVQSASGVKFLSLEGFPTRDSLVDRVKPGATVGEDLIGAYEVRGGRPVEISIDENGQVQLKVGAPRPGANPMSPEKMIRKAEAAAAERAKTRPKENLDRGRRGR